MTSFWRIRLHTISIEYLARRRAQLARHKHIHSGGHRASHVSVQLVTNDHDNTYPGAHSAGGGHLKANVFVASLAPSYRLTALLLICKHLEKFSLTAVECAHMPAPANFLISTIHNRLIAGVGVIENNLSGYLYRRSARRAKKG